MRLVLVRHGEAESNLSGAIAGPNGCTGLSALGRKQAHALAARWRATGELNDCTVLLSSPLMRARQTADILASALPVDSLTEDDGLCELDPGEADGLSRDAFLGKYGEFDMLQEPTRPLAPGGESWSQFTARVRECLQRLAMTCEGRTVVAVSHSGFVVVAAVVLFDIPRPGTGARLDPLHTSLTEWQCTDNVWSLIRYNDASHLGDMRHVDARS